MITKKRSEGLSKIQNRRALSRAVCRLLFGTFTLMALWVAPTTASALIFNLNYDPDSTFTAAGLSPADIVAMKAANTYAAAQFINNFSDPIHVNINITAVPGTGTVGGSTFSLNRFTNYTTIRNKFVSDATSQDDATAIGTGGSLPLTDIITGTHNYMVPTALGKALGLIGDSTSNTDGTYTFGGGWSYTYDPNNRVVPGKIDYIGVAMHEFSEIMGRAGLMGVDLGAGGPSYYPYDLFHFSGSGTHYLSNGGSYFSIDGGITNLKGFNNQSTSGGDLSDWAFGKPTESFNAFIAEYDVKLDMTPLDLRTMDVIGYNRILPEPSSALMLLCASGLTLLRRRRASTALCL